VARDLYIGLMSGTSLDAIDAVLVDAADWQPLATRQAPLPESLRAELLGLAEGAGDLDTFGRADRGWAECAASLVGELLAGHGTAAAEVRAIGCHGQTVRHCPAGKPPYTLQIGDPNTLAERTGICVAADFRRRDLVAGGQGAPLAPAFHAALWHDATEPRAIVNIGGMANVTLLLPGHEATGFDTGPGNVLMDGWVQRHHGRPFDADGDWARRGLIDSNLLLRLLAHPFFAAEPPKSTGRETFNLAWLDAEIAACGAPIADRDVQATVLELTATSISTQLRARLPAGGVVYLCGGGAHNRALRERLTGQLPGVAVRTTAALGIEPDWVEAAAFAWLAHRRLQNEPGNLPGVTGASRPVVLGGVYVS
jgi:anhydro-N-acetylmuramic acid kinase